MSDAHHDESSSEVENIESVSESGEKVRMGNYQKLSDFMGTSPTMSMFRRFTSLNVQNLLFLQAELAYLEDELESIRQEEQGSDDELSEKRTRDSLQSFSSLKEISEDGSHSLQYETILKIREKLNEYSEYAPVLSRPEQFK
ncbi:MAG: hypothetical protein Q9159_005136 [Coniocarpon cinnabarinum]